MSDESLYRILDGVHRCVAAHKVGRTQISAVVDTDGSLGPEIMVPLERIYSPKTEIRRFDRNRDFEELLDIMRDDDRREMMTPVVLVRLSPRRTKYWTPVASVAVNPA